ncbi:hypothetical protein AB0L63_26045 [Nocardia sp. NPDC051990]|uniref:AMP-binding enzyme n=1 Tax=Nocardia sp. NPDC051990 TaxID=3155285 RepID=UPI00343B337E
MTRPHRRALGCTGDRVIRGSDGWFRFVDRIKDVIRRRGENISATEVESVLSQHPGVAQVAVFPVPSTLAEDEVMAAIVPRNGITLDPADLLRFAEQNLAYFAPGGGAPAHRDGKGTEAGTALPRCSAGHLGCRAAGVPADARSMTSRAGAIVRTR